MTRPVSPRSWYADPMPSAQSIRKADRAIALVASGLCPGCGQSKDVERESVWCAKCDGKEEA